MATWLAIAIPSIVAVAAVLMWTLDYSKKAHEIQKLRLELEKLKREAERLEREEQTRASGLYRPTAAEVDRIGRVTADSTALVIGKRSRHSGANAGDDDGASEPPSLAVLASIALFVGFLLYGVIRLVIDLVQLFIWMF
jgi:hypothetical protein